MVYTLSGVNAIRQNPIGYPTGGNIQIRFDLGSYDHIGLTVNASFSAAGSSGMVAGRVQELDIQNTTGGPLTLTWNPNWIADVSALPASIAAGATINVVLRSTTTADTGVLAKYVNPASGVTGPTGATGPAGSPGPSGATGPAGSGTNFTVVDSPGMARYRRPPGFATGPYQYDIARDVFNVKDYGALGNDGVGTETNNTIAVQAAINAIIANGGGRLYYPGGTYRQNGVSIPSGTTVTISIVGDGQGVTRIKFMSAIDEALFDLQLYGSSDPATNVSSFSDITLWAGAVNKRLVRITGPGTSTHRFPGIIFTRCEFASPDTTTSPGTSTLRYETGVELVGVWNPQFQSCWFAGPANPTPDATDMAGTGLLVNNTTYLSVNGLVNGCRFNSLNKSFYIGGVDGSGFANNTPGPANCEGWVLRDCIFIAQQWSITELFNGSGQTPWLASYGCEFEPRRTGAVFNLAFLAIVYCEENTVLLPSAAQNGFQDVFVLSQVGFSHLCKNNIGAEGLTVFKLTNNCGVVHIEGNIINSARTAIYDLGAATSNIRIRNNSIISTVGTYLIDAGTDNVVVSDGAGYGTLVKRSSNQSIAASTDTAVIWESAFYNNFSIWSGGSPTRLTVPNGVIKVRLTGNIRWQNSGTSTRFIYVRKNGSTISASSSKNASLTAQDNITTPILNVTAGDYFEFIAYQTEAGAINIEPNSDEVSFGLEIVA